MCEESRGSRVEGCWRTCGTSSHKSVNVRWNLHRASDKFAASSLGPDRTYVYVISATNENLCKNTREKRWRQSTTTTRSVNIMEQLHSLLWHVFIPHSSRFPFLWLFSSPRPPPLFLQSTRFGNDISLGIAIFFSQTYVHSTHGVRMPMPPLPLAGRDYKINQKASDCKA